LEDLHPTFDIIEAFAVGDVENKDSATGILEIGRNEGLEPLLSTRIPELQPVVDLAVVDILGQKVNGDSRLS
jgi:hypothetical protein